MGLLVDEAACQRGADGTGSFDLSPPLTRRVRCRSSGLQGSLAHLPAAAAVRRGRRPYRRRRESKLAVLVSSRSQWSSPSLDPHAPPPAQPSAAGQRAGRAPVPERSRLKTSLNRPLPIDHSDHDVTPARAKGKCDLQVAARGERRTGFDHPTASPVDNLSALRTHRQGRTYGRATGSSDPAR